MRQGGSGGEGHQCYHLEPPVVPCEQNSVPVSLKFPRQPATATPPGHRGRVRQTATEGVICVGGGGDLYLDELRFDAPERFITGAKLRNEPPRHRSY